MGKMTIGQMVAQLAGGMLISTQIFVITPVFSSTWTYCGVRTLIEKSRDQHDRKILHLYHARNSVNAAADGRLFRTILSVSY